MTDCPLDCAHAPSPNKSLRNQDLTWDSAIDVLLLVITVEWFEMFFFFMRKTTAWFLCDETEPWSPLQEGSMVV